MREREGTWIGRRGGRRGKEVEKTGREGRDKDREEKMRREG